MAAFLELAVDCDREDSLFLCTHSKHWLCICLNMAYPRRKSDISEAFPLRYPLTKVSVGQPGFKEEVYHGLVGKKIRMAGISEMTE